MLDERTKSELCKICGECCKCIVLPISKPDTIQKSVVMKDWLEVREGEVIRETKDNLYVKFPYPCPHLSKSDKGFTCEMYHQRPQGCRIFDGSVYDFLDCAWKKAETRYVVDLRKSKERRKI